MQRLKASVSRLQLALSLTALFLLLPCGQAGAAQPAPLDKVELVRLATALPGPDTPSGALKFEVDVTYQLRSVQSGFLTLVTFEDDDRQSREQTSDLVPVDLGAGRVSLEIEYLPRPQTKMLTMVVGLFTLDQKMLSWVATSPLPLAAWGARVEFEQAMAARMAVDHLAAIEHLSSAIQASPGTGNLYFWRGDTYARLARYDEAIGDFDAALELMPLHRASLLGRGAALLWKEEWEAAVTDLSAVLDVATEGDRLSAWAYRARGLALAAQGMPEQAVADYESYLDLTPGAADRPEVESWIADLESTRVTSGEPEVSADPAGEEVSSP